MTSPNDGCEGDQRVADEKRFFITINMIGYRLIMPYVDWHELNNRTGMFRSQKQAFVGRSATTSIKMTAGKATLKDTIIPRNVAHMKRRSHF